MPPRASRPSTGDGATSSHPAVQQQLDRLHALGMGGDVLGLERVTELCARLGNPHEKLPPVFHVAGTNGKGSTLAFLRAALEAGGAQVHAFTSPHLVRFNERIRLAGELIDDDALAALLEEVIDAAEGMRVSFFEATTAAAFLAFSRTPADACLVEVGLGGRLDATNIVTPVVTGIAALGMDHMHFLGDTLAQISGEKAGIAKPGVPMITLDYAAVAAATITARAAERAVPLVVKGRDWDIDAKGNRLFYRDGAGTLDLPRPKLPGAHQADNLGLAAAMLRHQDALTRYDLAKGAINARWPARMQWLSQGPLTHGIDADILLDGAHNEDAAQALAAAAGGAPLILMAGILGNRDAAAILTPFAGITTRFIALPVAGHDAHRPDDLCAIAKGALGLAECEAFGSVTEGFEALRDDPPGAGERVLVLGSLYLAGDVLRLNEEWPD